LSGMSSSRSRLLPPKYLPVRRSASTVAAEPILILAAMATVGYSGSPHLVRLCWCPMPQSIPSGLTAAHVLQALADLDAGIDHPFGQPTGYELIHDGKRYAPKAVIGLACRGLLGRVLLPEEFSGGEAPGQANYVLRKLGFNVVKKTAEEEPDTQAGKD